MFILSFLPWCVKYAIYQRRFESKLDANRRFNADDFWAFLCMMKKEKTYLPVFGEAFLAMLVCGYEEPKKMLNEIAKRPAIELLFEALHRK